MTVLSFAACTTGNSLKPPVHPITPDVENAPNLQLVVQKGATAMKLVNEKNWPQAQVALQAVIEDKDFRNLPVDIQFQTLRTAGRAALYHGPPKLAYGYFARVTSMPQADSNDWLGRLKAADKLGDTADSVSTLTVIVQRWPDRSREFDPRYILNAINEAIQLPPGAALPLLQALYDGHWKLKWDIAPSAAWRDLALLLVEKNRFDEARDVASHVTDVYILIAMRADRRFDALVAANPGEFDIEAAADRELQVFQEAAEKTPGSLELESHLIEALISRQRYEAALAASDAVLSDIRSTNYPSKLFQDYDDENPRFLNLRAIALERVGRWNEAVAQLTAASILYEKYGPNVDELINLADLYSSLSRPDDALSTIGRVGTNISVYGSAQMEAVRLDAAMQLGDSKQVERSLQYLRLHRADAAYTYAAALVVANRLDAAADELVRQLRDTGQRQGALLSVQNYALSPGPPRDMEMDARWRSVISKKNVQEAIRTVGRADSYPRLEDPN